MTGEAVSFLVPPPHRVLMHFRAVYYRRWVTSLRCFLSLVLPCGSSLVFYLERNCFCSSCTCCWALMTEEASSGVHLVFSLEGGVFLTAVISCGSWLSELSATALCSDLQRNYTWDWGCYQLCWSTGVLAEIVGLKIMSEHQGTNQSQPLISFHTNHLCLIRYNFSSIKLHKFQEQVRN